MPVASDPARCRDFIGRDAQLARLQELWAQGHRLVTVTGAAGMGKTQFALHHLAAERTANSVETAWFCELSETEDAEGIVGCVGQTLGVPLHASSSTEELVMRVGDALDAHEGALLVLDNFEQVVEFGEATISRWLSLAPDLRIVVTSRERLRLAGEAVVALPPLSLPSEGADSPADLMRSEAVRLFRQRAEVVRSDFQLTDAKAASVAAIVRALDGMPLAIELCAARVGLLGVEQLRKLLQQRFELLAASPGTDRRHRTLRAAIDGSWDLLDAAEQDALAQCCVFHGGWDMAAAISVLGQSGSGAKVMQLLQSLYDRSLVCVERAEGLSGERRFRLYESISAYAREKLSDDAFASAQARHARHYVQSANRLSATSPSEAGEALARLALEVDNLRAAHRWLVSSSSCPEVVTQTLQLLCALEEVGLTRGLGERYVKSLQDALALADEEDLAPALRARAEVVLGVTQRSYGNTKAALGALLRGRQLGEDAAEPNIEAKAALWLAGTYSATGELVHADHWLQYVAAILPDVTDRALAALHARMQGFRLIREKRFHESVVHYRAALGLYREIGARRDEGVILGLLGARLLNLGELDEARDHLERARDMLEEIGDRHHAGHFAGKLGEVDQEQGAYGNARQKYEVALSVLQQVGDQHLSAWYLGELGSVALLMGDYAEAYQRCGEAVAMLRDVGDPMVAGLFQMRLAAAEALLGRAAEADKHFNEAQVVLEGAGISGEQQTIELLRGQLLVYRVSQGDPAAAELMNVVEKLLANACPRTSEGRFDDGWRFAVRLLRQQFAQLDPTRYARVLAELGETLTEPDAPACASPVSSRRSDACLTIGPGTNWFASAEGGRVSLSRRPALRRILTQLVQRHRQEPGTPLSLVGIQEAGWPGERMRKRSADARSYTTISRMRKLGLGPYLVTLPEGYLLDPHAKIRMSQ